MLTSVRRLVDMPPPDVADTHPPPKALRATVPLIVAVAEPPLLEMVQNRHVAGCADRSSRISTRRS